MGRGKGKRFSHRRATRKFLRMGDSIYFLKSLSFNHSFINTIYLKALLNWVLSNRIYNT